MPEILLHHYEASPFAEKIRAVLAYKGIAWRSVEIPVVMPKPDLVALTGGYRKTPVLQIGSDVYCDTLRIALAAERTFEDIADSTSKERTKWFEILGNPPMRKLFETVFNLPASFGQIDVDRQAEVFADRSEDIFGTSNPSDFADPELQEKLLTRYTALSQLNTYSPSTSGASVALTLLSGF